MKKLLLAVALIATSFAVQAQKPLIPQRVVSPNDTASNVDTLVVNFNSIQSKIKSFQYTVTKVSGTVGGTVLLQETTDGIGWVTIDTLHVTNIASNTKIYPITSTTCNSYRAYFTSTGSEVSIFNFSYMRRPDE